MKYRSMIPEFTRFDVVAISLCLIFTYSIMGWPSGWDWLLVALSVFVGKALFSARRGR